MEKGKTCQLTPLPLKIDEELGQLKAGNTIYLEVGNEGSTSWKKCKIMGTPSDSDGDGIADSNGCCGILCADDEDTIRRSDEDSYFQLKFEGKGETTQNYPVAKMKKFIKNGNIKRSLDEIRLGLSWNANTFGPELDLDASIIAVTKSNKIEYGCYWRDREKPGVTHMGDNTTGAGSGWDEVIIVKLNEVPKHIQALFVVVHSFSGSFEDVDDACVAVFVPNPAGWNGELADYTLNSFVKSEGLVFCKLYRTLGETGEGWGIDALGWGCEGRTINSLATREVVLGQRKPSKFESKQKHSHRQRVAGGVEQSSCTIM